MTQNMLNPSPSSIRDAVEISREINEIEAAIRDDTYPSPRIGAYLDRLAALRIELFRRARGGCV